MRANMKAAISSLFLFVGLTAFGADRPKALPGYHWESFNEVRCDIQVPDGWFFAKRTAGLTQVVVISPNKVIAGRGIDTGFTMNAIKCRTQAEWKDAMILAGKMMSDARQATATPIESRVDDKPNMLLMILEGERFITNSPHPEKKYHVRAIVRAFPEFATIYMYSFGALADEWPEAWRKGTGMLNPIWFHLER